MNMDRLRSHPSWRSFHITAAGAFVFLLRQHNEWPADLISLPSDSIAGSVIAYPHTAFAQHGQHVLKPRGIHQPRLPKCLKVIRQDRIQADLDRVSCDKQTGEEAIGGHATPLVLAIAIEHPVSDAVDDPSAFDLLEFAQHVGAGSDDDVRAGPNELPGQFALYFGGPGKVASP